MSRLLGKELTAELLHRLDGSDVTKQDGKAIVIVTTDDRGCPHPAMLSYYEVVAKNASHIDLAIGKTSTTAQNMKRTGTITLIVTDGGLNCYIKGTAVEVRESMRGAPFMSLFRVQVGELLEDQDPGAVITSGVTFRMPGGGEAEGVTSRIFQEIRTEPLR